MAGSWPITMYYGPDQFAAKLETSFSFHFSFLGCIEVAARAGRRPASHGARSGGNGLSEGEAQENAANEE
jgi:hypothetical protein